MLIRLVSISILEVPRRVVSSILLSIPFALLPIALAHYPSLTCLRSNRDLFLEMNTFMGSDSTPNGIKFQFHNHFKQVAKRQAELKCAGADPKDVDIKPVPQGSAKKGGQLHFSFLPACTLIFQHSTSTSTFWIGCLSTH